MIVTASWPESRDVVIGSVAVAVDRRRQGIGKLLFDAILTRYPGGRIRAETDREAVGFYHSLGFRIRSLGELYPGVVRYECTYEDTDWKASSHEAATDA
jgi:ribosomal protein S18 acetylase RimI-like enzyme